MKKKKKKKKAEQIYVSATSAEGRAFEEVERLCANLASTCNMDSFT